ncbi:PD-(D/E)XK nuclease family protein [Bifidobacterium breve JCM 7019]|uniref:PD-(D/E)XK nuclease-like domain-containing protein n=1 Tax=Bifidobacterium breve TaxID=1685 RepID=UPI0003EFD09F|nr:PD-(D/E)XK nuclease-like domain-containing protein [Bifidobacterium breve]AHJ19268.1 PD-(D/E)XK nuclease family protein [Bifidobacterium breve JCM 7019]
MTVEQMTDDDYFALDAIDQTSLKKMLVSPLAYSDYLTGEHGYSSALEFGKAAHSMVLGSGPQVVAKPNLRTKEGKALRDRLVEQYGADDIVWLSADDVEKVQAMRDMVGDFFTKLDGQPEVAMIAADPDTGLLIKGKADWLPSTPDPDGVLRIRDYKTTVKSPDEFERSCWQYGYHIQAAFYMRLYRLTMPEYKGPLGFEFVVQEKNPPFDWRVWRFDEHSPIITELAEPKICKALKQIKSFRDLYPDPLEAMRGYGLSKVPQEIAFPDWRLVQEEEEIESWR